MAKLTGQQKLAEKRRLEKQKKLSALSARGGAFKTKALQQEFESAKKLDVGDKTLQVSKITGREKLSRKPVTPLTKKSSIEKTRAKNEGVVDTTKGGKTEGTSTTAFTPANESLGGTGGTQDTKKLTPEERGVTIITPEQKAAQQAIDLQIEQEELEEELFGKSVSRAKQKIERQEQRLAQQEKESKAKTEAAIASTEGAFAQTPGGLVTSTAAPLKESFVGAVAAQQKESSRRLDEAQAGIESLRDEILKAEKTRDFTKRKQLLQQEANLRDTIEQIEKEREAAEDKATKEARDIIGTMEKFSPTTIAGMSDADKLKLESTFETAGLSSFMATAFISENEKLAAALEEFQKNPTEENRNKVLALEGKIDKIRSEAVQGKDFEFQAKIKALDSAQTKFEAGELTQREFNNIKDILGIEREDSFEGISGGVEDFTKMAADAPAQGYRTDRHNNPTAFTTEIAKQAGLVEGVDYEQGDAFPNNPNMFTARLIGDPVDTTIGVINKIGFYTASGQQRWSHTAMSNAQWNSMTDSQKTATVKNMYRNEGGDGSLVGAQPVSPFGKFDSIIDSNINGFISDTEFKNAISGLSDTKQKELIAEKGRRAALEEATPEEKSIVTKVMRQLPTKLKDAIAEKKERQKEILADVRAGRPLQAIVDELKGFVVTNNDLFPLAQNLRTKATGTDLDLADLSAAINNNQPEQAMTIVENAAIKTTGGTDAQIRMPIETVRKGQNALELLKEVDPRLLGAWDSTLFRFLKKPTAEAFPDKSEEEILKAQRLQAKLTGLVAPYRLENLGSAVTPTEAAFLEPIMPDIFDQPNITAVTIEEFVDNVLQAHNAARETVNLPRVNTEQLLNKNERLKLYSPQDTGADPAFVTDDSNDDNLYNNTPDTDEADQSLWDSL